MPDVPEPSGLYYPNRIARAFFSAMDDVMGQHGLSTLLALAGLQAYLAAPPPDNLAREFDFAAVAAINAALEEVYGARGGRGMALRIGRASFASGLKNFGVLRGMADPAFRALSVDKQVDYGLQSLAALLTHFSDQRSRVEPTNGALLFISEACPFSWRRTADKPVCHMMVGLLQESLRWATNGYEFYVRETACQATGDETCTFRVNKSAIGERLS